MAGCGSKRKMAYGGKVKKMREGGMSEADKKTFGKTEMDQKPPNNFKKSDKKPVPKDKPGLKKLPEEVRNKMGYMKRGGKIGKGMTKNNYKKGGSCSSKSYKKGGMVKKHRGDGCATKGKTKGRMV